MRLWQALVVVALPVVLGACPKDDPGSAGMKRSPKEEATKKGPPPSVAVVKTPVPLGKKLDCEKLLDMGAMGEKLGVPVDLEDDSRGTADATTVCVVKLSGLGFDGQPLKESPLPEIKIGDELCVVKVLCGFVFVPAEMRANCEADGATISRELGDPTCAKLIVDDQGNPTGPYDRFIYSALDDDTRCRFDSHQGLRVKDVELAKKCLSGAMDIVGPESLTVE